MPDPSQPQTYEIRPDPQSLTQNADPAKNSSTGVDYEPHPESSIKLEPERQQIVDKICRLYSGSANEEDMHVYAEMAVYDDPWSYCDTRYKIAGQWYGEFFLEAFGGEREDGGEEEEEEEETKQGERTGHVLRLSCSCRYPQTLRKVRNPQNRNRQVGARSHHL